METFPQQPSPENIETEIIKLLENLNNYDGEFFSNLSPESQDDWYDAEMEAEVGKDRVKAKEKLEKFLKFLEEQKKAAG